MSLDDLKAAIAVKLDEVELLDILGISMDELVDILEEQIDDQKEELLRAVE